MQSVADLSDFIPPPQPSADTYETLFTGPARHIVHSPAESHETKKRSGSSDGAQTYDTPVL
ncbi:hypothetical protein H7827_19670 [Streptomyces sp. JH002]|uniref:hypothetical protein n=1 Tax=Streptomyces TaxID=1883 RepID=UPI0036B07920